ncbi:MAG: hypothetical protein H8E44_23680 [Planctomycetes bacterium]|nr:hypothetical protein [Planctomycetota bacterium]MBL7039821.1 hypothetical protein [Pirellulaceae bacterium]
MNDNDEFLRDVLLSGLEPSDELRDRFEQQVEQIVRHRLTTAEKWSGVFCITVFLPMCAVFGYVTYFVATVADPGLSLTVRLIMGGGFSLGSIVFLAGALYGIHELRRGRIAGRQVQHMMVAIPAAFVLLLVTVNLVFWDTLTPSVDSAIKGSFALLVYWIMVVGFVLLGTIRWQREDLLLEHKRTQLEIALLREALSK